MENHGESCPEATEGDVMSETDLVQYNARETGSELRETADLIRVGLTWLPVKCISNFKFEEVKNWIHSIVDDIW